MTIEVLFWGLRDVGARTRLISEAVDVVAVAHELLAEFGESAVLPGLELRRSDCDGTESLSIAIGPDEWALVHTDADCTQHRTRGEAPADAGSRDVRWDELTLIPAAWFVSEQVALAGVARWLRDGSLAADVPWSDDCA